MRKDGTRFWANVIITALRDPNGKFLGFSKVTRDLSERRAHEELLRQSEENIRLLVEGVQDHAIFLVDANGAVTNWNAGAERVLGFRSSDVIGRDVSLLYTGEDIVAGKPESHLATARDTGNFEDDGLAAQVGWHAPVGRHDDYRAARSRRQTARLRDYRARPDRAAPRAAAGDRGQRIHEFIAMLAHELRNPLAPIVNAVRSWRRSVTRRRSPGAPG